MKRKKESKAMNRYVFHIEMGDRGKVFSLVLCHEQAVGIGLFANEVNSLSHDKSILKIKATPDLPT